MQRKDGEIGMPRYRVTISGKDYDAMADLVRKYKIGVARHTVKRLAGGGYSVQAHATGDQIRTLEGAGYRVDRHEDVDAVGRERLAEVSTGEEVSRKELAPARVRGRYLNVTEVESALSAVSAPSNKKFTQLIELPNKTWEQRTCHALKIANGGGQQRIGIYLVGGVHAREWGSPDILINFVEELTRAYRTRKGLTIGSRRFTASQVQSIVNEKDICVFPQVNPDGRQYSMTVDPMWRKNRRPAPGGGSCIGVDINRNYDFLWNYPEYFDPAAPIANSVDPCDHDVYIGPGAASEPETRNVVWMFDTYPNIRYFIDIHSYSEAILYSWGDDVDQTGDPHMNFRNPAFNGKRGIVTDTAYQEYIDAADKAATIDLAGHMRDAIQAVRGRQYRVEQAIDLYPTAGTSDDYAFGRHIVDQRKGKVYAYTIEWGSENNPTPFHPPYSEMQEIIREITAALVEFCWRAGTAAVA